MVTESYVRLNGRIGFHAIRDELVVPSYLLQPSRGTPLPDGGMGTILRKGESAQMTVPELEQGRWRIELNPPNVRVTVEVTPIRQQDADALISGDEIRLRRRAAVSLSLHSPDATTVVGSVVLRRIPTYGTPRVDPPPLKERGLNTENELGPWKASGEAFSARASRKPRLGQTPISGAPGAFFNSFLDTTPERDGDAYRGTLTSPSFTATPTLTLHFRIGGGRAEGFDTQVGVRIVEQLSKGERRVRFVATGERDETLRPIVLDLGWLSGRTMYVEVFDEADGGWGHVLASDLVLTQ